MGPRLDLDSRQIPHFQVQVLHLAQAEFREPHADAGSQLRNRRMLPSGPSRAKYGRRPAQAKGMTMKTAHTEGGFQEVLERKAAEVGRLLRKRDDIAIEKSADQMDEIQYASERELAIRNVDRDALRYSITIYIVHPESIGARQGVHRAQPRRL